MSILYTCYIPHSCGTQNISRNGCTILLMYTFDLERNSYMMTDIRVQARSSHDDMQVPDSSVTSCTETVHHWVCLTTWFTAQRLRRLKSPLTPMCNCYSASCQLVRTPQTPLKHSRLKPTSIWCAVQGEGTWLRRTQQFEGSGLSLRQKQSGVWRTKYNMNT